jgi:hypothetical protein
MEIPQKKSGKKKVVDEERKLKSTVLVQNFLLKAPYSKEVEEYRRPPIRGKLDPSLIESLNYTTVSIFIFIEKIYFFHFL